MVTRAAYMQVLETLYKRASDDVNILTKDKLVKLCPHLTQQQIDDIYNPFKETIKKFQSTPLNKLPNRYPIQFIRIAMPPIFRASIGFILEIILRIEKSKDGFVDMSKCYLIPRSKLTKEDFDKKRYSYTEILFRKEAIEFAQNNWGEELETYLTSDSTLIKFSYYNPPIPEKGQLIKVGSVYIITNKRTKDLLQNSTKPLSEAIDQATVKIVFDTNKSILDEYSWYLDSSYDRYQLNKCCAQCGSGYSLTHCRICGYMFQLHWDWLVIPYVPLPKKVSDLLIKRGHSFLRDPDLARAEERAFFDTHKGLYTLT